MSIYTALTNLLHRELTELETLYVKKQYTKYVNEYSKQFTVEEFVNALVEELEKDNGIMSEPTHVNMHEILKKSITEKPKKKCPIVSINEILGTRNKEQIRDLVNPIANLRTAYIILDRKYVSNSLDNKVFYWDLAISGQARNDNTAISKVLPYNIVGIKMIPFTLPRPTTPLSFSKRISVLVHELDVESYMSVEDNRRFHLMFQGSQTSSLDPIILSNTGGETSTEYWLEEGVQELNSITLSFGNPFYTLTLDQDQFTSTISSVGIQTVINITTQHYTQIGDYISMKNFTTTNTSADYIEIALMNNKEGWPIVSITPTTLTIDVDLSGLTGVISNPIPVYLESKRFIIQLELKYLKK